MTESQRDYRDVASRTSGAHVIEVDSLRKTYAGEEGTVTAVDDVSFAIERGEVVGLLGPNGAGKTTTIKSILGLIEPTDGQVSVNGIDPNETPAAAYRHVSAVLEGARNVYWRLTVRENLRYFAGLQGIHPDAAGGEIDRLLSLVDLEAKADEEVRGLSRGMQQKACLACALVRDTPVVFLDEPTLGLDVEAARDLRRELRRLAKEENRTVVLSSHDMDVIQNVCDRVVIINEGRVIAEDRVDALLSLFSTQAYRIQLADPLPASETGRLAAFDPEWTDDRTAFEVTLPDSEAFYRLTDRLEAAGATIQDVDSIQPDLEEIFLSIVENESVTGSLDSDGQSSRNGHRESPRPRGGDR
jgi:ABC-2 type transport system ATP-binding protein